MMALVGAVTANFGAGVPEAKIPEPPGVGSSTAPLSATEPTPGVAAETMSLTVAPAVFVTSTWPPLWRAVNRPRREYTPTAGTGAALGPVHTPTPSTRRRTWVDQ